MRPLGGVVPGLCHNHRGDAVEGKMLELYLTPDEDQNIQEEH